MSSLGQTSVAGAPVTEASAGVTRDAVFDVSGRGTVALFVAPFVCFSPVYLQGAFGLVGSLFLTLAPVAFAARYVNWRTGAAIACGCAVVYGLARFLTPVGPLDGPIALSTTGLVGWCLAYLLACAWACDLCRSLRRTESTLAAVHGNLIARTDDKLTLQEEVGNLKSQVGDLNAADVQKDEALAVLAHELRNPLAAITSAVTLLGAAYKGEATSETHPTLRRWVRVAEDQTKILATLADDLLDVARIRHGKFRVRKQTSDLGEVVVRAAESCRPLLDERKHQLYIGVPPSPVYAEFDAHRITQVIFNLVQNAAKYTNTGGHVWVTLEKTPTAAVIRVRDDGVGITAEFMPYVWEIFSQQKSGLDRAGGGIGLGLTLVKRIVELHGGAADVTSDGEGAGSEFKITLPRAPLAWTLHQSRSKPELVTSPQKILIVEDNIAVADTLAAVLRKDGHTVSVVHDGLAALGTTTEFRPDVILLDIGLPDMDGYEIARRLRAAGVTALIVAVTGCATDEHKRNGQEAGIDHYVLKPADASTINKLLALPRPEPGCGVGYRNETNDTALSPPLSHTMF